ncbi:choice-of-anchor A family protein [Enterovibrio paralichthyis]|uniref:choice-of-anchor A family protein n=1 Tax=Enterovibrio paralichthyis TaxID=2853805 RepID=UPI001C479C23|nr:choice-of-anchor A family protein [Enterovibrio paralichthyis]MBV7299598.1 choice-of-anchor A family protein [Enterovibrio paralichthyis]
MKNIISITLLLCCSQASALENKYSALVFEDFSSPHSSSDGPLAIGNDANLNGYGILYGNHDFPPEEYALVVGGDLSYANGQVYYGSVITGGDISNVSESVRSSLSPGSDINGNSILPIDFSDLRNKAMNFSSVLSKRKDTGSVVYQWGGIYLEGDCSSDFHVFNVDGIALEKAHTLALSCVPEGATVIVNINGNMNDFKALSNISLSDFIPNRTKTVFNLYEATSLSISGVAIEGLLLAPFADISAPSGSSSVGIIANSWQGSMSLAYKPFNGRIPGTNESVDMSLKWHWNGKGFMPDHSQVMVSPIIGQLNDDNGDGNIDSLDSADVVVVSFKGNDYKGTGIVRALSGIDGVELWSYENGFASVDPRFTPALGDVDNDGFIEVVAVDDSNRQLVIFNHDGSVSKRIEMADTLAGNVTLTDIDSDGSIEILAGTSAYNYHTGMLFKMHWVADHISVDVDRDGISEVLSGNKLFDSNGQLLWSHRSNELAWFSSVVDTDRDTFPEILVSFPDPKDGESNLSLLSHTGNVIWEAFTSGQGGGAQAIGSFLGADKLGIAVAGYNSVDMFNTKGMLIWSKDINDETSGKVGVTSFDFDSDGIQEVVLQDHEHLYVLNGESGEVRAKVPNSTATLWEYPVVVDLEGDNNAEIIVVSNNYHPLYSKTTGVRVFESSNKKMPWQNATRIWNQHSYHQTNITQEGKVPQNELPSWLLNNSYRSSSLR